VLRKKAAIRRRDSASLHPRGFIPGIKFAISILGIYSELTLPSGMQIKKQPQPEHARNTLEHDHRYCQSANPAPRDFSIGEKRIAAFTLQVHDGTLAACHLSKEN
jgi:hypothetical protein